MGLSLCIFPYYFVSISQVAGCEDCLRNDLDGVRWGVKSLLQPTASAAPLKNVTELVVTEIILC